MLTSDEIGDRLRAAGAAWTSAHGIARTWRRRDLVRVGFDRYFATNPTGGPVWTAVLTSGSSVSGDHDEATVVEAVLAVTFEQGGRRRRAEALSRREEDWLADLLVVDGDTFWARTGSTVETNHGDPHHTHGGADVIRLLQPGAVPVGYDLAAADEQQTVAGRTCTVITATPRERDPFGRTPGSEVFDMITGGDDFVLSMDLETGCLLRVVKNVDGERAESCEFTEIEFDQAPEDQLFAALT